MNIIILEN